jgi:hypothetical protein
MTTVATLGAIAVLAACLCVVVVVFLPDLRTRWHSRRAWCTNCREQPAGPDGFCSPDCHDEWQDSIAY